MMSFRMRVFSRCNFSIRLDSHTRLSGLFSRGRKPANSYRCRRRSLLRVGGKQKMIWPLFEWDLRCGCARRADSFAAHFLNSSTLFSNPRNNSATLIPERLRDHHQRQDRRIFQPPFNIPDKSPVQITADGKILL